MTAEENDNKVPDNAPTPAEDTPKKAAAPKALKKAKDEELDEEQLAKLKAKADKVYEDALTASVAEYPKEKGQFEGQNLVSEHFAVVTDADLNGQFVTIKPRGWVGEGGLRVSPAYFEELAELLGKVNLPK